MCCSTKLGSPANIEQCVECELKKCRKWMKLDSGRIAFAELGMDDSLFFSHCISDFQVSSIQNFVMVFNCKRAWKRSPLPLARIDSLNVNNQSIWCLLYTFPEVYQHQTNMAAKIIYEKKKKQHWTKKNYHCHSHPKHARTHTQKTDRCHQQG